MAWFRSLSTGLRLAVAAGGVIGAALRLGLLELVGYSGTGLLIAIGVANVAGSAGVGATVEAARRWHWSPTVRTTLVVGVCGGLTTFSTVSLEVARTLHDSPTIGTVVPVVVYAAVSVAVCVAAVWAGRAVVAAA